jgi:hypothetical protein
MNFLASTNLTKHLLFHLDYSNTGNELYYSKNAKKKNNFKPGKMLYY